MTASQRPTANAQGRRPHRVQPALSSSPDLCHPKPYFDDKENQPRCEACLNRANNSSEVHTGTVASTESNSSNSCSKWSSLSGGASSKWDSPTSCGTNHSLSKRNGFSSLSRACLKQQNCRETCSLKHLDKGNGLLCTPSAIFLHYFASEYLGWLQKLNNSFPFCSVVQTATLGEQLDCRLCPHQSMHLDPVAAFALGGVEVFVGLLVEIEEAGVAIEHRAANADR